ncbi:MAG: hypothetical protein IJD04_08080 [Desulfovibrionaceae bacterium]|nr:hypothetical protein [Desulfovibrionaceae bacterium]
MKIQNELLTGILNDPQQLKKTGSAQPDADFAAVLSNELAQGQGPSQVMPGVQDVLPLLELTDSEALGTQSAPGFTERENQFMDELGELLNVVDSYSQALAGNGGETSLKSVYGILETISQKTGELKGALSELGDQPALNGIINELEVLASTERFKLNRGDYFV